MALTTQTTLPQITVLTHGSESSVQAWFNKQILNGTIVQASEPHVATFLPGTDVDAQMVAVNAALAALGYPDVSAGDVTRIKTILATIA